MPVAIDWVLSNTGHVETLSRKTKTQSVMALCFSRQPIPDIDIFLMSQAALVMQFAAQTAANHKRLLRQVVHSG